MNLFSQPKAPKRSPLAGMLQPNLMEMLQQQEGVPPGGGYEKKFSDGGGQAPPMGAGVPGFPGNVRPSPTDAKDYPNFQGTINAPPEAGSNNTVGQKILEMLDHENAGPLVWRGAAAAASPFGSMLLGSKLAEMATGKDMQGKPTQPQSAAPGSMQVNAPPLPSEAPPVDTADALLASDQTKQQGLDMMGGAGLTGSGIGATQDLIGQLAKAAQTGEQRKLDFKREFESTPELDELIGRASADLDTARGERKKPGLADFLVLALMNLSNKDYGNNANMVLGTGEQRQRESMLERRLAELEGAKASASMQGRRDMRMFEQSNRRSSLEQMLKQSEMDRKQKNTEQDNAFRTQKLGFDKLMQTIGQMRQQLSTEVSPERRKALQEEIDKLDPYKKMAQPQKPPPDQRQSRLFGDLVAGGGYA